MNPSHVDTTTLYGIVRALDCRDPAQYNPWVLQNITQVTADVIVGRQLLRSSVPRAVGQEDPRILNVQEAAGIRDDTPGNEAKQIAEARTRQWVADEIGVIRSRLREIAADQVALDWTDWHVKSEWRWRVDYRDLPLADTTFPDEVAAILDSDERVARGIFDDVRSMCEDSAKFNSLLKRTSASGDLVAAQKVWWASVIVRGTYYLHLTMDRCDCTQHPVRADLKPDAYARCEPTRTGDPTWRHYLGAILAVLTHRKKSYAERLAAWRDLIRRTKDTLAPEHIIGFDQADDVPHAVAKFARDILKVSNTSDWERAVGNVAKGLLKLPVQVFTLGTGGPAFEEFTAYLADVYRKARISYQSLERMAENPTEFTIWCGRAVEKEAPRSAAEA